MRRLISITLSLIVAFLFISWGSGGHFRINSNASQSFNLEMNQFQSWSAQLAAHASDADDRKAEDPTEAPKHYIDIDNYPNFLVDGCITENFDSAVIQHGSSFVYAQGILPWATLAAYDSLVACFSRNDWTKALLFASDLGHYVADGHMPLHICANYDGQISGNDGIHSRYESTMINNNLASIAYTGDSIAEIPDIRDYIFNYLYKNFPYADSVITADNYAKSISTNYYSTAYKQALWNYTKTFTIQLFKEASHALAELMYNAWLEAGSPLINPPSGLQDEKHSGFAIEKSYPNPFSEATLIIWSLPTSSDVNLSVCDVFGHMIDVLVCESQPVGVHSYLWKPDSLPSGVYYLRLTAGQSTSIKKIVYQN
jgi:hypothetical protein